MSTLPPYGSPQWQILTNGLEGGEGGGFPEAPADGQLYSRQGSTTSWVVSPSGGGGSVAWVDITGKPATFPPTLPIAQSGVTNLVTDLAGKEATANKGAAGGYASLDGGGKVPAAQLPAYVDDVLEYANLAAFPATGVTGVLYLALDTNKIYRWTGTVYVEVSPSAGGASPSDVLPVMDGAAAAGVSALYSRGDHRHPVDTSREASITAGTAAQYWRGDKSWVAFPTTMPPSAHVHPQSDITNLVADLALKAPLASPSLSGTPLTPTAAPGTNTTQIASTAFVVAAMGAAGAVSPSNALPLMNGAAAAGTSALYTREGHVHPTDTSIATGDALRVLKTGDTMTGPLVMPSGGSAAATTINFGTAGTGITGTSSSIFIGTAGTQRIGINNLDVTFAPRISANTGSALAASIHFGTSNTGFYGGTTISATVGGANKLTLSATDLVTTVPITSSGNFISSTTSAILAATGAGAIYLRPNGSGSATGEGVVNTNGDMLISGSNFQSKTAIAAIGATGSGAIYLRPNGGATNQASVDTAGNVFGAASVVAVANMQCAQGYKPGGGPWIDSSDARIKEDVQEYKSGLGEVLALKPVTFRYKGNDTLTAEAEARSPHASVTYKTYVGLIAQQAEKTSPDMVSLREGYIDGVKVEDMRELDIGPLIFKLVNSVKELHDRLTALEASPVRRKK